ncbi:hypothetical protein C8Q75DRAFT_416795 [Abortiporus biennis]|nr:hypothetical protein C8Q75DRAFT_416795 [Abortiporus biennis]
MLIISPRIRESSSPSGSRITATKDRPFPVHAEAELMALLKMVNSAILHPVQLVQARSAVIYASYLESICFMMFMEHLRLPGSHGRAVPWDPSSSGILDEILAKLAQKLRQDVLNLAIKNASMTIDKSRQSSPASDVGHEDLDFTYVRVD